jgi:hypothetical protein
MFGEGHSDNASRSQILSRCSQVQLFFGFVSIVVFSCPGLVFFADIWFPVSETLLLERNAQQHEQHEAQTKGLAFDQPHWQQLRAATPLSDPTRRKPRSFGCGALIASLLLCLLADHASMAVLVWMMSLTGAALTVAFTLTYRPSWRGWLIAWSR